MMLIRPVRLTDLDELERLAVESGPGMTNLPPDRELLEQKIRSSMDSFAQTISAPGDESYLMVLEDRETDAIAGTAGVIAAVGVSRPFYSYQLVNLAHTSLELDRYDSVPVLLMVNEYRGASEIATLYLTPAYRRNGNGRLLSRCRFLLLAEFPERFARRIMAEMRGVHDEQGHSVFWDSLGQHFLNMDFTKADYLSSLGKYQFIADLMPHFPIYVRLLPKQAQAVIGQCHEATKPALRLLEREGFRFEGYVDVFDAGPSIHAPLDQIRTVRESVRAKVVRIVDRIDSVTFMICNARLPDFRVCRGYLQVEKDGSVEIDEKTAEALAVEPGDMIRFIGF